MYLTIQEVAEQTGLSAHTIRYYEKSGVLPRVQRTASGIRQFTETDMASLRFISDYKKAGMPLEEISKRKFLMKKDWMRFARSKKTG